MIWFTLSLLARRRGAKQKHTDTDSARASTAATCFSHPRNTDAAPELAGHFIGERTARLTEFANTGLMQLPPSPARFFFCPRHSNHYRHAENVRGLRLAWLLGISNQIRRMAEPQLKDETGAVVSQCTTISGEMFAPASWVNAILARSPVTYDPGIKARNRSDLERKIRRLPAVAAAA